MSSKLKLVEKGDTGAKLNQTDFLKEFRSKKVTNNSVHRSNASHDTTSANSRVTHPFAKYNTSGQLQCVLCSLQVATDKAWPFHLQSRKHKDIMANLKKSASKVPHRENGQPSLSRKVRVESALAKIHPAKKLKSILKTSQATQPSDSDGTALLTELDATKQLPPPASVQPNSAPTSHVPADFFDTPSSLSVSKLDSADTDTPATDPEQTTDAKSGDGKLPEGFFDDPKRDARVRGVRPEEAMEKEWEIFQRLMETENEQSELIVAQQDQLVQLERDFTETYQQSGLFNRAEELRKQQEALAPCRTPTAECTDATAGEARQERGEPSDDESHLEFELELDWRAQAY